jgi:hypothetical protein
MRTSGTFIRSAALAAAVANLLVVFYLGIRPWYLRWGADDAEVQRVLPGDEAVPEPRANAGSTRAITIHAPRARVWPWLAQIGQDRAGFYSYELLEDMVGCEMPSTDRIRPEFQRWQAGDKLWMYPPEKLAGIGHALLVRYEPEHALAFATHQTGTSAGEPYDGNWSFVLEPIDAQATRFIVRGRAGGARSFWANTFDKLVFEPLHFLMERRMMEQIKGFAEGHPRTRTELLLEPLAWASLVPLLLLATTATSASSARAQASGSGVAPVSARRHSAPSPVRRRAPARCACRSLRSSPCRTLHT